MEESINEYSVYMHTSPCEKKYIGITKLKPKYRWQAGNGYRQNDHMKSAISKYGWNNFKHEVLYTHLSKREAEFVEMFLIAVHKSNEREYGYNISAGGHCRGTCSLETRKKISDFQREHGNPNKGKPLSEEQKQKLREANLGKKLSEETKVKISKAHKGREKSEQEKQNISLSKMGHKTSKETRLKISIGNTGKVLSEDHKQRLREANKGENHPQYGMPKSNETKRKIGEKTSRKVKQFSKSGEYIREFNSLTEACNLLGLDAGNIGKVCKGVYKTTGGYKWQYASGENS